MPEIGYFGSMRLMGCDGGEGDLPLSFSHSSKPTPNLLSVTASRFITKMGTLPDATERDPSPPALLSRFLDEWWQTGVVDVICLMNRTNALFNYLNVQHVGGRLEAQTKVRHP